MVAITFHVDLDAKEVTGGCLSVAEKRRCVGWAKNINGSPEQEERFVELNEFAEYSET